MKRDKFMGLLAASPLGFFMVPKSGERNVLDMTAVEFAERLGAPYSYKYAQRAMGMLITSDRELDEQVEMFENNRECGQCLRSTYRYRWLKMGGPWSLAPGEVVPNPWYCVCGFEVGVVWDEAIHGLSSHTAPLYHK